MKETNWDELNSYKSYVKKDRLKDFGKYCEINSKDPYCIVVVLGVHQVLRYLEWGDCFPSLKKIPKTSYG